LAQARIRTLARFRLVHCGLNTCSQYCYQSSYTDCLRWSRHLGACWMTLYSSGPACAVGMPAMPGAQQVAMPVQAPRVHISGLVDRPSSTASAGGASWGVAAAAQQTPQQPQPQRTSVASAAPAAVPVQASGAVPADRNGSATSSHQSRQPQGAPAVDRNPPAQPNHGMLQPPAPRGSSEQVAHRSKSKETIDAAKDHGKQALAHLGHALLSKALRLELVELKDRGCAPQRHGSWKYIEEGSRYDQEEREVRRGIAEVTISVVESGGYRFAGGSGSGMPVDKWSKMVRATQFVSCPAEVVTARATNPGRGGPVLTRGTCNNPMEEAAQWKRSAPRSHIACINPASAYHCGGAFLTGGLHAKEEQMCVMSTLFKGMQQAEALAVQSKPVPQAGLRRPSKNAMHIPETEAVLCPGVEVFRQGPSAGYAFLDEVVILDVVSIAMPNCNPDLRDSALYDPEADYYEDLVRWKWASALEAARVAGADILVLPAAGCGVFRNPSHKVARLLAEVLCRPRFWKHFSKIVVVAPTSFYTELEGFLAAAQRS